MKKLKVLIVDDHEVVRIGLESVLGLDPDLEVVGAAGSADEALALTLSKSPDVVVMDIRMPGKSGIEACKEILAASPSTRVIILTSYSDDEAVFESIKAGAAGYILKDSDTDGLIEAVKTVGRGGSLLDPDITQKVLERVRTSGREPRAAEDTLSAREKEILALIAEGKTNKQIGKILFLSENTVRNHVSNIFNKLNVHNRTEAAACARKLGIKSE